MTDIGDMGWKNIGILSVGYIIAVFSVIALFIVDDGFMSHDIIVFLTLLFPVAATANVYLYVGYAGDTLQDLFASFVASMWLWLVSSLLVTSFYEIWLIGGAVSVMTLLVITTLACLGLILVTVFVLKSAKQPESV